jgi:UDP-2,4-diacetamido-2,4,6-trideoxy-beta-L-altropyranose hydrolase/pseudaminic acid synthase
MKIFIRCDGGAKLGTGHIIRQLMIVKELKNKTQAEIKFLMKDIPEGVERVKKEGFLVKRLPETESLVSEANLIFDYLKNENPDLLILDILDTSKKYVEILKKLNIKIVSFDDHSEGRFLADLRFNILELGIEPPAPIFLKVQSM